MNASEMTAPGIAGEVLLLDPTQIDPDIDGRIGQFFPLKAEGLARRIAVDGQLEPVLVVRSGNRAKLPWKLVAGRHRYEACLSLGRSIEARVVSGSKEHLRRLQASENLDRRRMTALEEAMFVAAVAEIAEAQLHAKHGVQSNQQLGGKARAARANLARAAQPRTDGKVHFSHPGLVSDELAAADSDAQAAMINLAMAYQWRDEVRDALGMSESHIKRCLRIHRQLVVPFSDLMEALKEHPVADNASALLKLAGLPKEAREAELRGLIVGEDSAASAAPESRELKLFERAIGALTRMPATAHDALIEARIDHLSLETKRRIFAALQADLKTGKEAA